MGAEFAGVSDAERQRAVATLALSFTADPVLRWLYPEAGQYLTHFGGFAEAFGGRAFAKNTAWQLGDFAAAAMWLPPDVEPDGEATVAHFDASVAPEKLDDLMGVLGQMDEAHPKTQHWYLAWIGVDSALQGQGLGGTLMSQCLEIVDKDHLPAYLDNTNPRNIPFYERHGFEVTGESRAGTCPPLISMLRAAR